MKRYPDSEDATATMLNHMGKEIFLDVIAEKYLKEVASQTRGSHRVKRANSLGRSLVQFLVMMNGTPAERSFIGYLERAQQRKKLATEGLRRPGQKERIVIGGLLLERLALDHALRLDEMEALGAIDRVRRCANCKSWFWSRVKNQLYCRETCRVRHFQASTEGRQYKREWARKNYQRNKRLDDEAKKSATASLRRRNK